MVIPSFKLSPEPSSRLPNPLCRRDEIDLEAGEKVGRMPLNVLTSSKLAGRFDDFRRRGPMIGFVNDDTALSCL